MKYKLLFLFVEGNDDERFFQKIIKPEFERKHYTVKIQKYAEKTSKVDNFLKSIKAMGADYIYITDINHTSCITAKKQEITNKFQNIDESKIIVVIKEMESWYLAGLNETSSKKLGMSPFSTTDNITKEQFNNLIHKEFDSRIDFMSEILKHFSIKIANKKNLSFKYFLEKIRIYT